MLTTYYTHILSEHRIETTYNLRKTTIKLINKKINLIYELYVPDGSYTWWEWGSFLQTKFIQDNKAILSSWHNPRTK